MLFFFLGKEEIMYPIFDSHAHYNDNRLKKQMPEILNTIQQAGVGKVLNIAADMKSLEETFQLTQQYDWFYGTAGIHPSHSHEVPDNYLEIVKEYALREKIKAIGEIGLDFHYDFSPKETQRRVFKEQLTLAKELNMPVIIHDREAHGEILEILKQYQPKGVFHCYSGSAEFAKEVIKLGMYISFTGVITFKNAHKAVEAAKIIPLDRLLIETDCPYMAPEPVRGTMNHSGNLIHIAKKLAEIKEIPPQELIDQTYLNTCELFQIEV